MSAESCSWVSSAAGKPRNLCDNRDSINKGHAFFFVFHFELIHFSINAVDNVLLVSSVMLPFICPGGV